MRVSVHVRSFHTYLRRMEKAKDFYNLYPEVCKVKLILISHMQQNINFEFLSKHLRVHLGQYTISTDPSAFNSIHS